MKVVVKLYRLIFICSIFLFASISHADNSNLKITGVDEELRKILIDQINLNESLDLEQDIRDILAIYGYYQAKVHIEAKNPDNIVVKLKLPTIINNIDVKIIDDGDLEHDIPKDLSNLIDDYKKYQNTVLNQKQYERFKNTLLQSAKNNGYLDAEYVSHKIIIDEQKNSADIKIILNLKTLYHINIVEIKTANQQGSSNQIINNDFIFSFFMAKYQTIAPHRAVLFDTPFRNSDILELHSSLNRYFNDVEIKTNIKKTDNTVNLLISLSPLKNYLYTIGAGMSTDEGARVFGGVKIRNISSYKHTLDIQGKIAQYRDIFATNYNLPGFNPRFDVTTLGYEFRSDKKRSNHNIEKERHQISGQYQRTLEELKLQLSGGLSYRNEHYTDFDKLHSTTSQLLVPYFVYDQVFSDNRIQTYQGSHVNIKIEGANNNLLSDTSFLKMQARVKSIVPLDYHPVLSGLRFIGRGQLGQIWHTNDEKIPPTLRFFAGGSDTVRGYRFESLGPTSINEKGKSVIVGGDRLIALSGEVEKTFYKQWSAAAFYDTGNALNDWHNFRHALQSGVGIGIRWQSPLGAIRLDIANALDKKDRPWRLDLNIGPDL